MQFIKTDLPGVILIKPKVLSDDRGYFMESYKKSVFADNGINDDFIQDNHSSSTYAVLRGLHYQLAPKAQAKLVRCVRGCIFDVAVDIRPDSTTFGQWVGYELSEENKNILYIPEGFAHGFISLSKQAELLYKTNNEYSAVHDRGIRYDDPAIHIKWPQINTKIILSDKDKELPFLKDAEIDR